MDFADNNGRAVIITGMPYPPFKDPKVMLKREHCDQQVRNKTTTLGGGDWYNQQSARAVNQAIGTATSSFFLLSGSEYKA